MAVLILFFLTNLWAHEMSLSYEEKYLRTVVEDLSRLSDGLNHPPAPQKTYTIDRENLVRSYLPLVKEERLLHFIQWFSSYPNRFYTTESGEEAMLKLAEFWKERTKHLHFVSVEIIRHKKWRQPSVELTFKGNLSDMIILGGHGDSINKDGTSDQSPAPGADDNASGISVLTEILTILAEKGYRPHHTLKFIAYAAEEVGLLGSMEISQRIFETGLGVKGVIQFDGTNYQGSKDVDLVLVEDYTDATQNQFLGDLTDAYLGIRWSYDKCGYACSDHYSWTYRGYPASFPFESRISEENPHIHSVKDTAAASHNSARHSVNFAKLGLAYILELDK